MRLGAYRPRPDEIYPQGQWQNAPAGHNRIVQNRLSGILQAIWEPEYGLKGALPEAVEEGQN